MQQVTFISANVFTSLIFSMYELCEQKKKQSFEKVGKIYIGYVERIFQSTIVNGKNAFMPCILFGTVGTVIRCFENTPKESILK